MKYDDSRIKKLYFGAYDSVYGAFSSKADIRQIMNSRTPKVLGGMMEEECREVITRFFEKMRKNG